MSVIESQAQSGTVPGKYAGTRRLGFESLEEELQVKQLAVSGGLPPWLTGTLVRVTPAKLEIGGKPIRHWFDGLAMLNGFSFAEGNVSYASRFLQSEAYRKAREGKVDYIGFANDPCRAYFKRVSVFFEPTVNDNCNVNLARAGNRHIAMTEVPLPIEFDPKTLETIGLVEWKDDVGGYLTSAHPHFDFERGELINYVTHVSARGRIEYRIFGVTEGRTRRLIGAVPVSKELSYMHAFAMTERYVVLSEFPLLLNPLRMALERPRPLMHQFRWKPERGTRFHVLDRHSGELVRTHEVDGNFSFHHVNAFERGDELVLDIIILEDGPSPIKMLELDRARDPSKSLFAEAYLHRFRLPRNGGPIHDEWLSEEFFEMPRINYRAHNGREYRYCYGIGADRQASDWWDNIIKLDVSNDEAIKWQENGCYPSEAVFVATPGARDEDDGVLLSVVLDSHADRSFLLVLDARTLEEIARAEAPHIIPFGFHGEYFGD
jgi:beta,beta-carotene 9',10'-dioxygenase